MTEQKELHDDLKHIQAQVGKTRSYLCGSSPSSSPTRNADDGGDAPALLQPSVFGVTAREFQLFLLDAACNSWIHPRESEVHMDMTQPYAHYFIDSSHNTYLAGHQLQGQSSCDMYKKALLNGCRCVEIDCWDGPNGDPAVTHGFTLTSRLRFYDVIATIKEYGFQTSPYPIMLSLELHTSIAQQKEMVRMMKEAFGSDLLKSSDADASSLFGESFSPAGLEYKILVKGKRSVTANAPTTSPTTNGPSSSHPTAVLTKDEDAATPNAAGGKPQAPQAAAKGHHAVCNELNEVTYIAAMPFVSVEKQMTKPHFGVSSVDENKIDRWVKEGPAPYIELSKRFLLRVYPKGLRTDSSNFNPQNSWNCGAQLVALNIQTNDEGNRLNRYKFRVNGMCGMILKPLVMRTPGLQLADFAEPWVVKVRVLCGIQIPKPGRSQRGEVIDPYVELFISGFPGDDTSSSRKKTKVIDNNGFNPHWDETFTFNVKHPELAMLCVQVHERDPMSSELIADNAVPLTALREGYRCVPLYIDGVQLQSPSCLLCHFSVTGRKGTSGVGSAAPALLSPPAIPISASDMSAADIVLDAFTESHMDLL
ncbi:phospholipase C-like protein, putative [Bodo saltans]|uniref:Phosphoinositide phospholipase C n=1 Tax=Bodo saltans TaxID=75058 RepID=A0A0S4J9Y4_BODSA|nr:phospholipase C-like protein, putative [Bodo saltans]|eukprot:CUG85880.1 phospholipase C-like protein, putative [Bodo saltans]